MPQSYYFSVPDIQCAACAEPIKNTLLEYKKLNITKAEVDTLEKQICITVEQTDALSNEEIQLVITELDSVGFEAILIPSPAVVIEKPVTTPTPKIIKKPNKHNRWFKGILASLAGLSLLTLSLLGIGLPLLAMYIIGGFSTLLTLYTGKDIYYEATKKLVKTKKLTMDSLFAVSTLVALTVSIISLFIPGLPSLFDTGLMIFGFRHLGKAIEEAAKQRVLSQLRFRDRVPLLIELAEYKDPTLPPRLTSCHIKDLQKNHIIIVRKGQIIPVDGECLDEESSLYDTNITGKPLPRIIKKGQPVLAGMRVAEDVKFLKIKVTATEELSYLARSDRENAQRRKDKAPLENAADKVIQYFVPAVFTLAIAAGLGLGFLLNPIIALQCSISWMVSVCPCILGFIVPLAVKIGIAKAAEFGVQFKDGKKLQAAQEIDTVVFDLNGTLTKGKPKVTAFKCAANEVIAADELLDYVYALEDCSQHPIANAICAYAKKRIAPRLKLDGPPDKSRHSGIRGSIGNTLYTVGNKTMMDECGIDTAEYRHLLSQQEIGQLIFIAREKKIIGYITLQDPLRKDAKFVVETLQNMGKQVHICTGSNILTGLSYAKALGINPNHVMADCSGSSESINNKPDYIKFLQAQKRKVAMIGDAANDAIAITQSHLGIAVQSNASDEITRGNAGAVIHKSSLLPVLTTFSVANLAVSNIKQNLGISLAYNITAMAATLGILLLVGIALNPGIGVALMILQSSLVLLNAYRFKCKKLPHLDHKFPAVKRESGEWKSSDCLLSKSLPCSPVLTKTVKPVPLVTRSKSFSDLRGAKRFFAPALTHQPNNRAATVRELSLHLRIQ